jgi:hypothetical protein
MQTTQKIHLYQLGDHVKLNLVHQVRKGTTSASIIQTRHSFSSSVVRVALAAKLYATGTNFRRPRGTLQKHCKTRRLMFDNAIQITVSRAAL